MLFWTFCVIWSRFRTLAVNFVSDLLLLLFLGHFFLPCCLAEHFYWLFCCKTWPLCSALLSVSVGCFVTTLGHSILPCCLAEHFCGLLCYNTWPLYSALLFSWTFLWVALLQHLATLFCPAEHFCWLISQWAVWKSETLPSEWLRYNWSKEHKQTKRR